MSSSLDQERESLGQEQVPWADLHEHLIVVEASFHSKEAHEDTARWVYTYYVITKMNAKSAWLDRCSKTGQRAPLAGLGEKWPKKKVPRWILTSSKGKCLQRF
jgi:hypothetical protein